MPLFDDTSPDAARFLLEGYRKMSPAEKMKRICELSAAVRQLAEARIRKKYPGISEREVRLHYASTYLDRETMIAAFGWDPEEHR